MLYSYLFATGIIGNPNNEIKKFINLNNADTNNNFAIEERIESKRRRILSFYLKDYVKYDIKKLSSSDEIVNLYLLKSQFDEIKERKNLKYEKIDNYKDLYLIKLYAK